MPIVSNQLDDSCDVHFVFRENAVILKDGSLPGADVVRRCLELNVASDWFSEPDKNYSAVLLEKGSPNPGGCTDVPLREFFSAGGSLGALAARARGLMHFKMSKRYCASCGGALRDDTALTARTCVQCGRQFFPQIEPAVIVLVSRGDDILLARHVNRLAATWACLAGFVETGETAEDAVRREVLEETGISVKDVRYVASQAWPVPDQLMLAFRAEYEGGEIREQPDEIAEARWFRKDALPEIPPRGSVAHSLITGAFG